MTSQRFLKRIHVCGTLWFLLCAATLLVFSLREAGFKWWFIFSVSGYSAVLLFFVFTVYLFAVYQGVVRYQTSAEHPLSTSVYYIALYDVAPFLGTLAGLSSLSYYAPFSSIINIISEGTLGATFLVWILFDPIIGIVETMLPKSAAHRKQRLALLREQKQQQKEENQRLLLEIEQKEQELLSQWIEQFEPMAKEASQLLCLPASPDSGIRDRIIELGAVAWKSGGIVCMRHFHQLIIQTLNSSAEKPSIDYTTIWWDGIGTWRKPHHIQELYLVA